MKSIVLSFILFTVLFNANCQELWGTTSTSGQYNWGTIYSMNMDGSNFNVHHNFDFTFGGTPMGNLCLASDGQFYGTCFDGGTWVSCTIYSFNPITDNFTHLWDFDIVTGDYPMSGMVEYNGDLYGLAFSGGSGVGTGYGVIYTMNISTGVYTMVHALQTNEGGAPICEPIIVDDVLWGVTSQEGLNAQGTLFQYDLLSGVYTAEHHFDNATGAKPYGSIIYVDGKFYGTTTGGGLYGSGVIYSYDPSTQIYTKLHDFNDNFGAGSQGALYQANNGLLYGLKQYGGANNLGGLFSFDITTGTYEDLVEFDGNNGMHPVSDLVQFGDYLYGTNKYSNVGCGNIFRYHIPTESLEVVKTLNNTNGCGPYYGTLRSTSLAGTEGVSEVKIDVFPNPTTDFIEVNGLNLKECEVIDCRGQKMNCPISSVHTISSHGFELDVRSLAEGAYFIRINRGEIWEQRSFIKY